MTTNRDVAVIVGSLRRDSFSRKIARALTPLAPAQLKLDIIEIGQLPLYNEDSEQDVPAAYGAFRQRLKVADAVLFVTPEYNRSVPGVLKNALDVGSRPYGQNRWGGKPGAIISVTPGALGAFGANHHLRQSLVFLDVPALQQPEAYIAKVADLIDANGAPNEATRKFLQQFLQAFADWIEQNIRHK
jgi:chromate reductase